MFKKRLTMVDDFIRRSVRPKPVVSTPSDDSSEEAQSDQKISHLGQSARVTGDINLTENLCIEGEIEGTINIRGKRLSISNRALVKGEVRARIVQVRGTVKGDVHGDEVVHLHSSASVTGNVHCKRILIDDGAQFDGTLKTLRETVKAVEIKSTTKPTDEKETAKPADSKPKLRSVGD